MDTSVSKIQTILAPFSVKAAQRVQANLKDRKIEILLGAGLTLASVALIPVIGPFPSIVAAAGLALLLHGLFQKPKNLPALEGKAEPLLQIENHPQALAQKTLEALIQKPFDVKAATFEEKAAHEVLQSIAKDDPEALEKNLGAFREHFPKNYEPLSDAAEDLAALLERKSSLSVLEKLRTENSQSKPASRSVPFALKAFGAFALGAATLYVASKLWTGSDLPPPPIPPSDPDPAKQQDYLQFLKDIFQPTCPLQETCPSPEPSLSLGAYFQKSSPKAPICLATLGAVGSAGAASLFKPDSHDSILGQCPADKVPKNPPKLDKVPEPMEDPWSFFSGKKGSADLSKCELDSKGGSDSSGPLFGPGKSGPERDLLPPTDPGPSKEQGHFPFLKDRSELTYPHQETPYSNLTLNDSFKAFSKKTPVSLSPPEENLEPSDSLESDSLTGAFGQCAIDGTMIPPQNPWRLFSGKKHDTDLMGSKKRLQDLKKQSRDLSQSFELFSSSRSKQNLQQVQEDSQDLNRRFQLSNAGSSSAGDQSRRPAPKLPAWIFGADAKNSFSVDVQGNAPDSYDTPSTALSSPEGWGALSTLTGQTAAVSKNPITLITEPNSNQFFITYPESANQRVVYFLISEAQNHGAMFRVESGNVRAVYKDPSDAETSLARWQNLFNDTYTPALPGLGGEVAPFEDVPQTVGILTQRQFCMIHPDILPEQTASGNAAATLDQALYIAPLRERDVSLFNKLGETFAQVAQKSMDLNRRANEQLALPGSKARLEQLRKQSQDLSQGFQQSGLPNSKNHLEQLQRESQDLSRRFQLSDAGSSSAGDQLSGTAPKLPAWVFGADAKNSSSVDVQSNAPDSYDNTLSTDLSFPEGSKAVSTLSGQTAAVSKNPITHITKPNSNQFLITYPESANQRVVYFLISEAQNHDAMFRVESGSVRAVYKDPDAAKSSLARWQNLFNDTYTPALPGLAGEVAAFEHAPQTVGILTQRQFCMIHPDILPEQAGSGNAPATLDQALYIVPLKERDISLFNQLGETFTQVAQESMDLTRKANEQLALPGSKTRLQRVQKESRDLSKGFEQSSSSRSKQNLQQIQGDSQDLNRRFQLSGALSPKSHLRQFQQENQALNRRWINAESTKSASEESRGTTSRLPSWVLGAGANPFSRPSSSSPVEDQGITPKSYSGMSTALSFPESEGIVSTVNSGQRGKNVITPISEANSNKFFITFPERENRKVLDFGVSEAQNYGAMFWIESGNVRAVYKNPGDAESSFARWQNLFNETPASPVLGGEVATAGGTSQIVGVLTQRQFSMIRPGVLPEQAIAGDGLATLDSAFYVGPLKSAEIRFLDELKETYLLAAQKSMDLSQRANQQLALPGSNTRLQKLQTESQDLSQRHHMLFDAKALSKEKGPTATGTHFLSWRYGADAQPLSSTSPSTDRRVKDHLPDLNAVQDQATQQGSSKKIADSSGKEPISRKESPLRNKLNQALQQHENLKKGFQQFTEELEKKPSNQVLGQSQTDLGIADVNKDFGLSRDSSIRKVEGTDVSAPIDRGVLRGASAFAGIDFPPGIKAFNVSNAKPASKTRMVPHWHPPLELSGNDPSPWKKERQAYGALSQSFGVQPQTHLNNTKIDAAAERQEEISQEKMISLPFSSDQLLFLQQFIGKSPLPASIAKSAFSDIPNMEVAQGRTYSLNVSELERSHFLEFYTDLVRSQKFNEKQLKSEAAHQIFDLLVEKDLGITPRKKTADLLASGSNANSLSEWRKKQAEHQKYDAGRTALVLHSDQDEGWDWKGTALSLYEGSKTVGSVGMWLTTDVAYPVVQTILSSALALTQWTAGTGWWLLRDVAAPGIQTLGTKSHEFMKQSVESHQKKEQEAKQLDVLLKVYVDPIIEKHARNLRDSVISDACLAWEMLSNGAQSLFTSPTSSTSEKRTAPDMSIYPNASLATGGNEVFGSPRAGKTGKKLLQKPEGKPEQRSVDFSSLIPDGVKSGPETSEAANKRTSSGPSKKPVSYANDSAASSLQPRDKKIGKTPWPPFSLKTPKSLHEAKKGMSFGDSLPPDSTSVRPESSLHMVPVNEQAEDPFLKALTSNAADSDMNVFTFPKDQTGSKSVFQTSLGSLTDHLVPTQNSDPSQPTLIQMAEGSQTLKILNFNPEFFAALCRDVAGIQAPLPMSGSISKRDSEEITLVQNSGKTRIRFQNGIAFVLDEMGALSVAATSAKQQQDILQVLQGLALKTKPKTTSSNSSLIAPPKRKARPPSTPLPKFSLNQLWEGLKSRKKPASVTFEPQDKEEGGKKQIAANTPSEREALTTHRQTQLNQALEENQRLSADARTFQTEAGKAKLEEASVRSQKLSEEAERLGQNQNPQEDLRSKLNQFSAQSQSLIADARTFQTEAGRAKLDEASARSQKLSDEVKADLSQIPEKKADQTEKQETSEPKENPPSSGGSENKQLDQLNQKSKSNRDKLKEMQEASKKMKSGFSSLFD